MSATLTVEVKDADAVSRAAQSALELTRTLGGFVVSSSVATGDEGSASIVVRVPVDKVQDAITGLSGLGRIVSQQVTTADRQESIDAAQRRTRSLRAQIALVTARLESGTLDAETQARLEARLKNLKADLLAARRNLGALRAEARMSTIQLTVVTPGAFGAVAPPSRIDRAIDEALNVLAWEGVVALGIAIVLAPFALVAFAAWLGPPALPPARGGEAARDLGRRAERRDQRLRDDLEGASGDLARLAEPCEGLFLGEAFTLHEDPLRALDRLPGGEGLRERVGLLAQSAELLVPSRRGRDRRQQVGLAERLDEVAEDARPRRRARRARARRTRSP